MTLLLSDKDARQAVDQAAMVDAIRHALLNQASTGAVVPARMNLDLGGAWLRVMPAIVPSAAVMGLKVFNNVPGQGVRYVILLFDLASGSVTAAVDACYLTAARTAATSAVAFQCLANPGPIRVGLIGSGLEAETHCDALAATAQVVDISVFSPNKERRRAFAQRTAASLGVPVHACDDPHDALRDADHVVVATNTGPSQTIACYAEWLHPGQHVSSIGSTHPLLRELDTQVFRAADLIVVDAEPRQIAEESADVIAYQAEGGNLDEIVTLPELITGSATGRQHKDQLTLFKSVGTALQDVVAADLVYRRARELGLGTDVPELAISKQSAATARQEKE